MRHLQKQLAAFLLKLNTRLPINWQPEFRIGRPLYDFLIAALQSGRLLPHQTTNAMVVVFRLRALGSHTELVEILTRAASHCSIVVRTKATTLIVGLMRLHGWQSPYTSDTTRAALAEALRLGVYKDTAELATRSLERLPDS